MAANALPFLNYAQTKQNLGLELLSKADNLDICAEERWQYLTQLRTWLEQSPILLEADLSRVIAMAYHLCDWQLLICLDKSYKIEQLADQQIIAYAHWKLGHWQHACHMLQQLMFTHPNHSELFGFYQHLVNLSELQRLPCYFNEDAAPELSLEPLSYHHCEEFLWQYWDPKIAELCCLPEMNTPDEWRDWFNMQLGFDDQTCHAVYHKEYGFVGVVSLIMHEQVGFIYYWLGKDFQAKGLGSKAAKLLMQMAIDIYGLDTCYAKVFTHNLASQQLLLKLGFKPMPFQAVAPFENETFFYWGEQKSDKEQAFELAELFIKMQSPVEVDMPLDWELEFNCRSQFKAEEELAYNLKLPLYDEFFYK